MDFNTKARKLVSTLWSHINSKHDAINTVVGIISKDGLMTEQGSDTIPAEVIAAADIFIKNGHSPYNGVHGKIKDVYFSLYPVRASGAAIDHVLTYCSHRNIIYDNQFSLAASLLSE